MIKSLNGCMLQMMAQQFLQQYASQSMRTKTDANVKTLTPVKHKFSVCFVQTQMMKRKKKTFQFNRKQKKNIIFERHFKWYKLSPLIFIWLKRFQFLSFTVIFKQIVTKTKKNAVLHFYLPPLPSI